MNSKRFLIVILLVVLAMGGSQVFSQQPLPGAPNVEPNSPDSTWGEYIYGTSPYYGTWWNHQATSGTTYAVVGQNGSSSGRGVWGRAYNSSGVTYGVWGVSESTSGRGVVGEARASSGATYGVYGTSSSTSGRGVVGQASSTTGYTYGVIGSSNSDTGYGLFGYGPGTGVYGSGSDYGLRAYSSNVGGLVSGDRYGVQAYASSTSADAIYARATATSGPAWAVNANTNSPSGWAGYFTSAGNGIYSAAGSTYGVYANANNYGVYASANSTTGVGVAAFGYGDSGTGVYASGTRYGVNTSSSSTLGRAINARATATSGPARAIHARTDSPNGWGGVFSSAGNGVYIVTPNGKIGLTVVNGTKNAAVATEDSTRLLYTEESTEVWFTDYGFGTLERGRAVIPIDSVFAQTVNLDEGYHVFLQAYGNANLYVSRRTPTYFVVQAQGARGTRVNTNLEFSYRLVAKRAGYEDARLEPVDVGTMELQAELDRAAENAPSMPAAEMQRPVIEGKTDAQYHPEDAVPLNEAEARTSDARPQVQPNGRPTD